MSSMSLKQTVVIGCPGTGKSKFLRNLGGEIFTSIKKRGEGLEYPFIKRSFRETQEKTRKALLEYIRTHPLLYLDEPFYYLLPFEEKLFKAILTKNYIIATHRTAYFLLSCPSIILINQKGQPLRMKISELGQFIKKPSLDFFKKDLINYFNFLNQFSDIYLKPIVIDKIKRHPDFKNTRTTYFVRDFLTWFALYPGDFIERVKDYKIIIQKFFKENCRDIPRNYQKVINNCLGSFGFRSSEIFSLQ